MTANGLRGESILPGQPAGTVFFLKNDDFGRLQTEFGASFIPDLHQHMAAGEWKWMEAILKAGVKDQKTRESVGIPPGAFDAVLLSELADGVLDAVYFAVHGRKFAEHLDWLEKKAAEEAAKTKDDRPTMAQEAGSDTSTL